MIKHNNICYCLSCHEKVLYSSCSLLVNVCLLLLCVSVRKGCVCSVLVTIFNASARVFLDLTKDLAMLMYVFNDMLQKYRR